MYLGFLFYKMGLIPTSVCFCEDWTIWPGRQDPAWCLTQYSWSWANFLAGVWCFLPVKKPNEYSLYILGLSPFFHSVSGEVGDFSPSIFGRIAGHAQFSSAGLLLGSKSAHREHTLCRDSPSPPLTAPVPLNLSGQLPKAMVPWLTHLAPKLGYIFQRSICQ